MLIWQIVQSRWGSSPTPHLLNRLSFTASNNLHYSLLLSSLQQPLLTSSGETNFLTVFTVGWVCLFHNNFAFYTNIHKQGGNTNEGRARNLVWLCRSIDLPPSVMSSFQPSVNTPPPFTLTPYHKNHSVSTFICYQKGIFLPFMCHLKRIKT